MKNSSHVPVTDGEQAVFDGCLSSIEAVRPFREWEMRDDGRAADAVTAVRRRVRRVRVNSYHGHHLQMVAQLQTGHTPGSTDRNRR